MDNVNKLTWGLWVIGLTIAIIAKENWITQNRELGHLMGLCGLTLMFTSYANLILGRKIYVVWLWLAAHVFLLFVFAFIEHYTLGQWIKRFVVPLTLYSGVLFFSNFPFARNGREEFEEKIESRLSQKFSLIIVSVVLGIFASWFWELLWQPLIGVYGGPARETVQFEHVGADFLGISIAAFGMMLLPNNTFKSDSQRSAFSFHS
ncbi:hypothetical protein DBT82_RS23305 [Vibrio parahaemolyticus]|uniref:hypothetical protein n=1 Tax=Vibrio parahaemolyticus TaxID=670 RepID=UPI0004DF0E99|nr:hypothetical protein [Vibrio parahaemolyticus]EJG0227184.1 hypothetical protein [Vibrio parahaemolyticus]EJG0350954.1 hypothetical protein [Vibrio parahaemolyticus]EJG0554588.1 hypothetical protein [Vibrio parahaemolyticus]MBE4152046.1 hypothetical protein [Vibrio parahaemolyticus]MBM5085488.1 hypothetical protein [Vibrio parahaemolyticus]